MTKLTAVAASLILCAVLLAACADSGSTSSTTTALPDARLGDMDTLTLPSKEAAQRQLLATRPLHNPANDRELVAEALKILVLLGYAQTQQDLTNLEQELNKLSGDAILARINAALREKGPVTGVSDTLDHMRDALEKLVAAQRD